RGAGWNVLKVIWGDDWDPLLAADDDGLLVQRMNETVDGEYQRYVVAPGSYIREKFFGTHPKLLQLVGHLSDEQLQKLRRGGHDPAKVYAAYQAAVEHREQPTVILAKTIKGYGLGEAGEGRNITHQQKKLNEEELRQFRDRFDIPIGDGELSEAPFYKPPEGCEELEYLRERRRALGGPVPRRLVRVPAFEALPLEIFADVIDTSVGREVATTMAVVRMLAILMADKRIGKLIVPIVPDEARTFGMDPLFRKFGIYSHKGQLYEPVDSHLLLYYREAVDGQILEEGITEAGSLASFTAAGTAYASHGINCIPFFFFYSMFGFQRIGDMIWAHGDARGKGFLIGATAGRTTLAGEGLQHQDGHSLIHASTVPNCVSYDAAYVYELAIIVQDGIRRMYEEREDVFYYLTVQNEKYVMPPMPEGVREGVLRGLYRVRETTLPPDRPFVHLFGSGAILNCVMQAQQILAERYGVGADVWSVTSYTELRREALDCERWNRLHPTEPPRVPYIMQQLSARPAHVVAASDYVKLWPDQIARWTPQGLTPLGTDGFGRSESREALRRFFEVDAAHIVVTVLHRLAVEGRVGPELAVAAIAEFGIAPDALPLRIS
ncbi:MAG: pyruvate dehydrogenase (acetyl-transferring), homodimeric type, partial [Planctomycetota bacterium]